MESNNNYESYDAEEQLSIYYLKTKTLAEIARTITPDVSGHLCLYASHDQLEINPNVIRNYNVVSYAWMAYKALYHPNKKTQMKYRRYIKSIKNYYQIPYLKNDPYLGPSNKSLGPSNKSLGPSNKSLGPSSKSFGPSSKSSNVNYQ